jgi:hypothetical protein
MIPIEKKQPTPTIAMDEITNDHLVVAVIQGHPCILGKGFNENWGHLSFYILGNDQPGTGIITRGNGYNINQDVETPAEMIREVLRLFGPKTPIEVFDKKDWKQALQFLIQNA